VYLFESGAAGLTEVGAFAGQPGSMLGWSLAFRGEDALVGAPLAGQGTGLIVVYGLDPATGQWGAKETITPAQPLGPGFGFSIAVAGEELVVGAPLSGAEGNGVAYLFQQGPGGAWGQLGLFESETAMSFYGASVAGIDGAALIGAPGADVFEGMAQLVERETAVGGWTERGTITATGETMESITGDVVECTEGQAGAFGCTEVDLVAFLPVAALGGTRASVVNDVWGWTDPETSREYAIVGRNDGTAFVDLSAPGGPMYLGDLAPTAGSTVNMWRDIKVYANHAFIVADGVGAHGIQIFDLTTLRGEPSTSEPFPRAFTETAHYDGIFSAHNIVINEESGFAYVVGAGGGGEVCGGGLHMVDIRDPGAPTFAGCFSDPTTGSVGTGYSHDAMCVNYRGPDTQYVGRELCFGANETALSIADVTDKSNPVAVATASYPNVGYLHQGWISEDHRYFYMNDELDELSGLTPATRTLVWDIQELDDPILAKEHLGTTSASDHNLYVSGNLMYQSNYVSGLRILDISDPENPREVGFFDTVTEGENTPGFAGSWSNYPFFPSGMIAVTSMKEGLFIVRKRPRIS
jgi:choice-of-anchor B domain-containing protein